ncbi:MAG: hypothetical protein H7320_18995 [Ferruginibacter sp.]|nr:hypothetical protein [Ferruginibacter sp.]
MGELQIKKQAKVYDVVIVGSGAGGGMPADVLQQYNMAYTEKKLKECISFDNA